ncbi:hypothetical protein [Hyphococcus sp.]|jgi:hypothetical protein|uniref:hypothetical protein n=1 Tax=Hyphococcus sp. TaxID=2038636 RepID=UPI003D0F8E8B
MRLLSFLFLVIASALPGSIASAQEAQKPPQWYLDDIEFLTRDGGRWVASNAEYKGENDPMDAYVIEWEKGYAHSMTGRLYGVRDGEQTGDFWRMFQYWDPGKGEAVVTQFGFGGAIGLGRAWTEDGVNKSVQTFYAPDGGISGVGHESANPDADTHLTHSFDIVDDVWNPRRSYSWIRDKTATE